MSSKYAVLVLPFFIGGIVLTGAFMSSGSMAESSIDSTQKINNQPEDSGFPTVFDGSLLLAQNYPSLRTTEEEKSQKKMNILVTAYSSSPEETDDTPLITASGSFVHSGVVAANFLPFGTKIRLPEIFGNKIFVVEDRLHKSHNDRVDIWFPSKEEAVNFGYQVSEMEIL